MGVILDLSFPIERKYVEEFMHPRLVRNSAEMLKMEKMLSVDYGDSVNCQVWTFIPHLHGTHLEVQSHACANPSQYLTETNWIDTIIPKDRVKGLFIALQPSKLVPEYGIAVDSTDIEFIKDIPEIEGVEALIIKLYPDGTLQSLDPQRYFSVQVMHRIRELLPNIKHLLTDAISVDPFVDHGVLAAHKAFWDGRVDRTITEICNLRNLNLKNGTIGYLQLQVIRFGDGADALPCRPIFHIE